MVPKFHLACSRRRENRNSKREQHEANERKGDHRLELQKRHRAAALHDAGANSRVPLFPPGFGVRQPYAALTFVRCQAEFSEKSKYPPGYLGDYEF